MSATATKIFIVILTAVITCGVWMFGHMMHDMATHLTKEECRTMQVGTREEVVILPVQCADYALNGKVRVDGLEFTVIAHDGGVVWTLHDSIPLGVPVVRA